jgi:hypothetical protein
VVALGGVEDELATDPVVGVGDACAFSGVALGRLVMMALGASASSVRTLKEGRPWNVGYEGRLLIIAGSEEEQ